ncbi:acyltransferase [Massilia timonae]|uniref:acyltransferase n=1 Tax=Massilia timonae TaxID=47229 RepID=UPI00289AC48F|nr:hypothetical protein [Massilia timonae]
MQELEIPPTAVSWRASSLLLPGLDNETSVALSELGVTLKEDNGRKFSQALCWAGVQLSRYKILENHPDLPHWWVERRNKLFVPINSNSEKIPSITSHPGIPFPEDCVIFLNGATNYSILLWGSGTLAYISPESSLPSAHFAIGDGFLFIGPNVRSTARLNVNCRNDGSVVLVSDILIGSDVKFQTDDCHTIISVETGTRINPFGGTIIVKNHVWLGEGALVLGDSFINSDCIIGARSFIRGIMTPKNAILAGVPGKVTRTGITWDSRDLPPDHPDLISKD